MTSLWLWRHLDYQHPHLLLCCRCARPPPSPAFLYSLACFFFSPHTCLVRLLAFPSACPPVSSYCLSGLLSDLPRVFSSPVYRFRRQDLLLGPPISFAHLSLLDTLFSHLILSLHALTSILQRLPHLHQPILSGGSCFIGGRYTFDGRSI